MILKVKKKNVERAEETHHNLPTTWRSSGGGGVDAQSFCSARSHATGTRRTGWPGQGRYGWRARGRGGRAPAQEAGSAAAAHAEGGRSVLRVRGYYWRAKRHGFGHEPPQITRWCLKVVRRPDMFVSPFCCSWKTVICSFMHDMVDILNVKPG